MMFVYAILSIGLLTYPPVLCQSQNPPTCTGPNEYFDEKTGTCTVCPSTCPPGYGFHLYPCGKGEMKRNRCYRCEAGFHNTEDDDNRCYPCNMCLNRQTITNCTKATNANCGSCDDGYGWDQFREVCKKCEDARTELPGCEKPPELTDSEIKGHSLVCEDVAWQSVPDKYYWFRNSVIIDTSDENKFFTRGHRLLILNPSIEDKGSYQCSAKWNANNEHKFDIVKMSSNKVELSIQEQHGDGNSDNTTNKGEPSTKGQYEDGNDVRKANATVICRRRLYHEWKTWLVCASLCGVCLLIPPGCVLDTLRWLCYRMACRNGYTTNVIFQSQVPTPLQQMQSPLLCRPTESQMPGPVSNDTMQNKSEKPSLEGSNDTSIQMECENVDAKVTLDSKQKIARQPEETLKNLYKTALECCSELLYEHLDMSTTDRVGVLLNPLTEPMFPIKCWKHLANELGYTDEAMLNHLGSYKRFHALMHTECVSMGRFLDALWKVNNHEATKIVCMAIIKLGNK